MRAPARSDSPLHAEAHELDDLVRRLSLRRRLDQAARAKALLQIAERRLYRVLGYASMTAYGRAVEGLGASTTCELLKIAGGCRGLPRISEAFYAGRLPAGKAKVLVALATPDDEEAWLERAKTLDPPALRALGRGEERRYRPTMDWAESEMGWAEVAVRGVRETEPGCFTRFLAESEQPPVSTACPPRGIW
jgi:hypothetical protein